MDDLVWEHQQDLTRQLDDIDQAEAEAEDTQRIIDQLRRE